MNIEIKMDRDFELALRELDQKYGEDFEILNGFHKNQMDFSEFIDAFVDKNVADVTIDANANANGSRDIRSLLSEKGKSIDKMFAFNKIFMEIKKEYGLSTAKKWLEAEYSGLFYLHDAPSSTFIPYCLCPTEHVTVKYRGQSYFVSLEDLFEIVCEEAYLEPKFKIEYKIPKDLYVLDYDPNAGQMRYTEVEVLSRKKTDKEVVAIETETASTVLATADHRFITTDGEVKAGELKDNTLYNVYDSEIFTNSIHEYKGCKLTWELGRKIGKELTEPFVIGQEGELRLCKEFSQFNTGFIKGFLASFIYNHGSVSQEDANSVYLAYTSRSLEIEVKHLLTCMRDSGCENTGKEDKVAACDFLGKTDGYVYDMSTKSHTFVCNQTLVHNCYAYDLSRLAKEGLFFLSSYNNEAPKHLTTFLDDVIEYVSFFCNRSSGAVGLPNIIPWIYYFWKTDVLNNHYTVSPESYLRQCLQKLIYRLNQPFLRCDQSSFTNVSIFDREYLTNLFGGLVFPDGSLAVDQIEEIMEVQKTFMDVVSKTREHNMFTFPVLTYSLLYKDGKFQDEEFAKWASNHNILWNDSNFFISDNVGVLSNCCFYGKEKLLIKDEHDNIRLTTFEDFYEEYKNLLDMTNYMAGKQNVRVLANGEWRTCKPFRTEAKPMYLVSTISGKQIICTEDHVHVTGAGEKTTKELIANLDGLAVVNKPLAAAKKYKSDPRICFSTGYLLGLVARSGVFDVDADGLYDFIVIERGKLEEAKHQIKNAVRALHPRRRGARIENSVDVYNIYPEYATLKVYCDYIADFAAEFGVSGDDDDFSLKILDGGYRFIKGFLEGYLDQKDGLFFTGSKEIADKLEILCSVVGMNVIIDKLEDNVDSNGKTVRNIESDSIYEGEVINKRNLYSTSGQKLDEIIEVKPINIDDEYAYCVTMIDDDNPYFTLPNGIVTHNCRLLSDTQKLDAFVNSIGGTALSIGSLKVSTINLMRIAILSGKSEYMYLEMLKNAVVLDCKVLDRVRHIIKRNIEKGLLPNYQDGGIEIDKQYNTVGILGVYEVIEYFGYTTKDQFGNVFYTDKGLEFAKKIFDVINKTKDEFSADKDYSCNVESVPAERAAVILAQKDLSLFGVEEVGDKFIYSNQFIPLTAKTTIQEKLRVDAALCKLCGGGVISHINLENNFPNEKMAWDMLNRIAESGVIYSAFCTRINECENHHGFVGTDTCPVCGGGVYDTYQRIVGFLTPSRNYSTERKKEFSMRQWWDIDAMKD